MLPVEISGLCRWMKPLCNAALRLLQVLFHLKAGKGKEGAAPLLVEASHLSLFAAFWWMVLSITITGEELHFVGAAAASSGWHASSECQEVAL